MTDRQRTALALASVVVVTIGIGLWLGVGPAMVVAGMIGLMMAVALSWLAVTDKPNA